ncbi:hypothetical protein CY652_21060, partial [Burkholderia sp. WAC0059]|uniref:autotransporter outer membrane beta-barrel domain-containing protein n=1 Tax=Burkholderia sp. WAC0059 TaxID=2066022 RepID=UPI000CC23B73
TVGTDNVHSLQPYVGVSFGRTFGRVRPVTVGLDLGYAHELLGTARAVLVQAPDGTPFGAPGVALPHNRVSVGLHLEDTLTSNLRIGIGYGATFGIGSGSTQAVNLSMRYVY